ncbi:MAG: hypothetical protein NTY36_03420 [Deltaproteobacteria bacterium]|nr:hypothetical protein [Deltaproteobacteria bacterium]
MRLAKFLRLLAVLFLVGVLMGLPLIAAEVQARGGGGHGGGGGFGGSHGGGGDHGGFGGGSFHSDSYHSGGEAGRRPEPGPDHRYPDHPYNRDTNVNVNRNVNVTGGGWGPYHGGGWGGVAAGAAAGLAVGTVIGALSASAQPMIVNNQTYYYDGGNYYQSCYQGTDSSYCVVPNPNE